MVAPGRVAKMLEWHGLGVLRDRCREAGKTVVWTNGCFDLMHVGHVRSLQAARALGDVLVVGLNSDESVRRLKGRGRPILPAVERAELLAALACVDYVTVFDDETPERVLAWLRPAIHTKGADYAPPGGKPVPEAAVVAAYGGQIRFLEFVPARSTSALIRQISELGA
jgi:rfaE bifunctional protein nucleotidyltransferase chain/domain